MKKTCLVLATLTTLILMSCNNLDNSITSAEDLSLPQTQTLQKSFNGSPLYELPFLQKEDEIKDFNSETITRVTNSRKCVSCGSMSVNVPYGYTTWSSAATCDFTSVPSNAVNTSYQFIGSGPSGGGSFSTDSIYVVCGNYYIQGIPLSLANISTNLFAGKQANVKCYLQFHGKCNGTAYGGGNCTLAVTNIQGCQDYQY